MTIYPTPYAQLKEAIKAGLIPVCIDRIPLATYYGKHYKPLAPYTYMTTPIHTPGLFLLDYKEILGALSVTETISDLQKMSGGRDIALFATNVQPGKDPVGMACDWLGAGGAKIGSCDKEEIKDNQTSMF